MTALLSPLLGAMVALMLAGCAAKPAPPTVTQLTPGALAWRIQRIGPNDHADDITTREALSMPREQPVPASPDSLGAFVGRPTIINFWATWCAPCVKELADFQRLMHAVQDTDIAFVFVTAEPAERVRSFARRYTFELPFYRETDEVPPDLKVRALPTTIVIDRTGTIVLHHRGALAWNDPAIIARLRELAGS